MLTAKEKRELWLKDAAEHRDLLEGRAAQDIEKHRKGWCKIRFVDKYPVNAFGFTSLKVELYKGVIATCRIHVSDKNAK